MQFQVYTPSPEVIAERCREIRSRWTDRDEQERRIVKHKAAFTRLIRDTLNPVDSGNTEIEHDWSYQ